MSTAQWFVECDSRDNESLARVLADHSIGDENKFIGLEDSEGRPHDVWLIPSWLLTKLRAAKRVDKSYAFRFWVRNTRHSPIRSAEFVEQKSKTAKLKKALIDIGRLKAKQTRGEKL